MADPTVVVVATLDTKGEEVSFVARLLRDNGCVVVIVDVGVLGSPHGTAEVDRWTIARAGGCDLAALVAGRDRANAMTVMATGAARHIAGLTSTGRVDAVLGLGGSNAAYVMARVCRSLPLGLPKLLVSTVAAGRADAYTAGSDLMVLHPVVDLSGLNRIVRPVLANAAAAVAGMAATHRRRRSAPDVEHDDRPAVALTMAGTTTRGATRLRHRLERAGLEVLPFHANGTGGMALEELLRTGRPPIAGTAELTTTELADQVVGGHRSAGPDRLTAAGLAGLPQVVSLGGLDFVNFGPPDTVPARFADRRLHRHNPMVTLMRTGADECGRIGHALAVKLNRARGPVAVVIPERGLSELSVPGGPLADADADRELVTHLLDTLSATIPVTRLAVSVNDDPLTETMAETLIDLVTRGRRDPQPIIAAEGMPCA